MNLKDKTLDITIKDYLLSGGIKHINPYADFKINEFKKMATEIWTTPESDSIIISININKVTTFEIVYDNKDHYYVHDSLNFNIGLLRNFPKYVHRLGLFYAKELEKSEYMNSLKIVGEVSDQEEKVLFLSNGVNLHFLKSDKTDDYLIIKIVPDGEEYRSSIRKIFREVNLSVTDR